jgi:hypothetical protein
MKRLITLFGAALLAASALMGCAGTVKTTASDAQARAMQARADADKARAEAEKAYIDGLRVMVDGAGDGPRLAAVMAAFTARQSIAQTPPLLSQPAVREPDLVDRGMQLLNVLLRGYEIERGASVAMHASDNARDVQLGQFGAFTDMAGLIQAPAVPQANQTTQTWTTLTQTASGAGAAVGGAGSYAAPSLGGAGVIGNGTYTANPQTTTGSYNPVDTTTYLPAAP